MKQLLKQVLPPLVWNQLRRIKKIKNTLTLARGFQRFLELIGYTVARKNDYYSPLPSVLHLKANLDRWYRPSALKGIDYDVEEMRRELSSLLPLYMDEFSAILPYRQLKAAGFGVGYTALDALTLYMMIRNIKPRRYIEVGSGLSTYYCSLAAEKNSSEGHPLDIFCIEPYPFKKLYTIPGIQIISKEVQDVELSLFQQLDKNDVLFIDSSHILKIDGDVPFLFLEVLPILNVGVLIHIHDVPFPYNIPYPPQFWIFEQTWPVFWNEAMVLQVFLCFNDNFKIIMSTPMIRYFDEPFLKKNIPFYASIDQNPNTFSSIWLKRTSLYDE